MSTTTRIGLGLAYAAALLLLGAGAVIAGGGVFPSYPGSLGFQLNTSGRVTAIIVIDPNGPVSSGAPATPTGSFGTIVLNRQGVGSVASTFRVEPDSSLGELQFGCNLNRTNPRFLEFAPGVPGLPLGGPSIFSNWLPSDVTQKLFQQIGVTLVDPSTFSVLAIPAVGEIVSQQCSPFPKAKDTLDALIFSDIINRLKAKTPVAGYPDLSANSVGTDPATQWRSGFLVLEVKVGFWAQPGTSTP
jgi:hypothetical protein